MTIENKDKDKLPETEVPTDEELKADFIKMAEIAEKRIEEMGDCKPTQEQLNRVIYIPPENLP